MTGARRLTSERGMAVVFSLGLVVLLGALGSSLLIRSVHDSQMETRSLRRHHAFFLAEAGLDQALLNLQTPADLTDDLMTGNLPTGSFTVDSMAPLGSQWLITTTGTSIQEQRRMEGIVSLTPQSVFQWAVFGDQQITVSGSATTDSYDSREGAYDEDAHDHHGDIGTNSVNGGGVTVGGSIFVDGQVAVGEGAMDPDSVVSGYDPAFITGGTSPPSDTQDVIAQSRTFPMPAVTVPDGLVCNDYTVAGNTTVTLAPGTYCYNNLTIQGNADLVSSGDVTIYITGELTAQGNSTVGNVSDPTKMLFLLSSSAEATLEQTITGSNVFAGAIYGPQATFNITGNATVYGSIVAKRVDLGGSAVIHYDSALSDVTPVANLFQTSLVSWREL